MSRSSVVFALALVLGCGCQSRPTPSAVGAGTAGSSPTPSGPAQALVHRVWVRSDSTGLPGVMRIFLEDGTLVMDSCWETYRLASWRWESDSTIVWQEDNAEIRARILEVGAERLVLRLALVEGNEDQQYRVAAVPYVCPDMKR